MHKLRIFIKIFLPEEKFLERRLIKIVSTPPTSVQVRQYKK